MIRFIPILLLIFLISCEKESYSIEYIDGIKVIHNNFPKDKNLQILLTPKVKIIYENITSFDLDRDNNIYILDGKKSKIFHYDYDGNLINSFGAKGHGPGEFNSASQIFCDDKYIYISSSIEKSISLFKKDGSFYEEIIINSDIPNTFDKINDNKFICFYNDVMIGEKKSSQKVSLKIVDKSFNEIRKIVKLNKEIKTKLLLSSNKPNLLDIKYAFNSKNIFYAINDKDKYLINVSDYDGKDEMEISKNFAKISLINNERNRSKKENGIKFLNAPEMNGKVKQENHTQYKDALNQIYCDKYDNLWVDCNVRDDKENIHIFDVFKNGIYINRVNTDIDKKNAIYLKEDKLIEHNSKEQVITIYEYDLKV